jgi:hypothetical protein
MIEGWANQRRGLAQLVWIDVELKSLVELIEEAIGPLTKGVKE